MGSSTSTRSSRRGGFLIVDDYGTYGACADAVHGYREDHGVTEPILEIDHTAVYWRKA